jgi:hypothetical protein
MALFARCNALFEEVELFPRVHNYFQWQKHPHRYIVKNCRFECVIKIVVFDYLTSWPRRIFWSPATHPPRRAHVHMYVRKCACVRARVQAHASMHPQHPCAHACGQLLDLRTHGHDKTAGAFEKIAAEKMVIQTCLFYLLFLAGPIKTKQYSKSVPAIYYYHTSGILLVYFWYPRSMLLALSRYYRDKCGTRMFCTLDA